MRTKLERKILRTLKKASPGLQNWQDELESMGIKINSISIGYMVIIECEHTINRMRMKIVLNRFHSKLINIINTYRLYYYPSTHFEKPGYMSLLFVLTNNTGYSKNLAAKANKYANDNIFKYDTPEGVDKFEILSYTEGLLIDEDKYALKCVYADPNLFVSDKKKVEESKDEQ